MPQGIFQNDRLTSLHRARGSVYLLVLSTSMLVTIIGLSAMYALRVERRSEDLKSAALEADYNASSLLAVALLRINNDPDWRNTYTHNVWEPNETIDNTLFTFKLVDEEDSNLGNDPNQPVRLYAKATVDEALRIYSVLLDCEGSLGGTNLLLNPDMEGGLTNWSALNCDIASSNSNPHSGSLCLEMTNGGASGAGPQQYITGIENGVSYDIEVWARKASGSSTVRITLVITSSGDGKVFFDSSDVPVDTTWTKRTSTLTPTWTGTLEEARVKFSATSGTYDMFIDDAVMRIQAPPTSTVWLIPGTCRREVQP